MEDSPLLNAVVTVNYRNSGNLFPGKISAVNADGTYNIAYDDGDSEKKVPENRVIFQEPEPTTPAPKSAAPSPAKSAEAVAAAAPAAQEPAVPAAPADPFVVGARVEVNYRSSGNYFPGVISAVMEGGAKFDIAYVVYRRLDSSSHLSIIRSHLTPHFHHSL